MLSETLSPRSYRDRDNLDKIADYISAEFKAAGGLVTERTFLATPSEIAREPTKEDSYRNVMATFGPETKERIVVGAHYDAFEGFPGADDNASGTAGLLELARMLGKAKLDLKVELVAYTLEEPPNFATPNEPPSASRPPATTR